MPNILSIPSETLKAVGSSAVSESYCDANFTLHCDLVDSFNVKVGIPFSAIRVEDTVLRGMPVFKRQRISKMSLSRSCRWTQAVGRRTMSFSGPSSDIELLDEVLLCWRRGISLYASERGFFLDALIFFVLEL